MGDLSEHFNRAEFMCRCGCGKFIPCPELVHVLEVLRWYFKKPIEISSGTRCPKHNKAVKGKPDSRHLYGDAADIKVQGIQPAVVADYCDKLIGVRGGVGRYATFTHIDVRGTRARWSG